MANPEHLAKLGEGVEAWNIWRESDPRLHPDLGAADLSGANLWLANLRWADLKKARFNGANLKGASLARAFLHRANLSETDLFSADLRNAHLVGADLSGADLLEADLTGANLHEAEFSRAILALTHFGDNDLSNVRGLETARYNGPSRIGIDTLYRSRGIPLAFLRGVGVPEGLITYMSSLTASPIEFYSCFISYSSKEEDHDFANELHTKLQSRGVRCWFAPEDLKIGERFQERIEESIKLYDKLLVILSENSVKSAWVEREVQAAFEKESRQGSTVLFPVRIDDAVMDCSRAWAADIRRTRQIGDFCNWKDHDSFQRSLDRLLRDLKSQDTKPG
jgi:uncharacterized protein YjbI with pentapeptide repeats